MNKYLGKGEIRVRILVDAKTEDEALKEVREQLGELAKGLNVGRDGSSIEVEFKEYSVNIDKLPN